MAKYNSRFAIGVEDFLNPPMYDRLAAEIDKQSVLNAANQYNAAGRLQNAVANGEYNVWAAKKSGQQASAAAGAGMWTDIAGGALSGLGGFAKNGGFNLGGGGGDTTSLKFGTDQYDSSVWTEGLNVGGYTPTEILTNPNIQW